MCITEYDEYRTMQLFKEEGKEEGREEERENTRRERERAEAALKEVRALRKELEELKRQVK